MENMSYIPTSHVEQVQMNGLNCGRSVKQL